MPNRKIIIEFTQPMTPPAIRRAGQMQPPRRRKASGVAELTRVIMQDTDEASLDELFDEITKD
jgi:hypothetical protein